MNDLKVIPAPTMRIKISEFDRIASEIFRESTFSKYGIVEFWGDDSRKYFVLIADEIIGIISAVENGAKIVIETVGLLSNFRNKGIGGEILNEFIEVYCTNSIQIEVEFILDDLHLLNFYGNLGFHVDRILFYVYGPVGVEFQGTPQEFIQTYKSKPMPDYVPWVFMQRTR